MNPEQEKGKVMNPNQHCTNKKCPYKMSHSAAYCGKKQKAKCKCKWCYPKTT